MIAMKEWRNKLLSHDSVVYAGFLAYALFVLIYLSHNSGIFFDSVFSNNNSQSLGSILSLAMTLLLYILIVARVRFVEKNSQHACEELKEEIRQMKINNMLHPGKRF